MIVTLTTNPAIDRTLRLADRLRRGAVQRLVDADLQAGGKGINVTRALRASGVDSVAVFPASDSDPFTSFVRDEGLPHVAVPIDGAVRTNIAVTEPDGTTTKLNEPGPALSVVERERIIDAVIDASRGANWLVLAGSLPPATTKLHYARVIEAVRSRLGDGAPRIAVDSSGEPLRDVLTSGQPVDLIKPNADELADLLGDEDPAVLEADLDRAVAAAERALAFGCGAILLTLGGAGAVYVDAATTIVAVPPPIALASTVGAGDAALAGFLLAHADGAPPARALAQAVAHGSAAASLPGSTLPARGDTDPDAVRVEVRRPGNPSASDAASDSAAGPNTDGAPHDTTERSDQ